MTRTPVPPIPIMGGSASADEHIDARRVELDDDFLRRLGDRCAAVSVDAEATAEAGRDWWPLAMTWAVDGLLGARAGAVAAVTSVDEVAAVARLCNDAHVPLTAAGGRSGVGGGSVPVHGGVVLDLTGLNRIVDVDTTSLILDVEAGVFGDDLESSLRAEHNLTLGHWPQSIALSTVGGWVACRSAGQMSTRYGKIEDMVVGLDAVLADGRMITTGGAPRAAVGPDLNQLFVGSEGTLGIITSARLRLHPAPATDGRCAYAFPSFADGLDACRRILQRGGRPAVLRLYDTIESVRNFDVSGDRHVLLVLDEGEPVVVDSTMQLVRNVCADVEALDESLVETWFEHRNDVSALESLIERGYVVDTMEVAARWRDLDVIYQRTTTAMGAVEGTLAVSAHQSHAYTDGACLYFTFGGKPEDRTKAEYYRAVWEAGTAAVLAEGGALSHHHGIGLNRSRFVAAALGESFAVLEAMKATLDPHGILNPGKLGLASPFGPAAVW